MAEHAHHQKESLPRPAALALALSLSVPALAQNPPAPPAAIPLAGVSARSLSNLADATETFDTFLGTDAAGPYVLGWKGIQSRGISVFVDGRQLFEAQFALDADKGELVFSQPLKRTQMARVTYRYYPGQAQRNASPATSAPLAASLGKFQVLALASPTDGSRKMVWGLDEKANLFGGGLKSQIYFAPESLDGQTREAGTLGRAGLKLGYNVGDAKNGLDASFLRGGRDFGGYGKQVGIAEATRSLNLSGRFNPNKSTGVSFSQIDNDDLTGKPGVFQQNLAARLGGLGFSQTIDDKPDAKGKRVRVETEKSTLDTALGGLKLAASNGSVQTLGADGKTTGTDSQTLDLRLAPKNKPALGFNRTESGTIDAAGKRSAVTTEKTDLAGKLGRATAVTANLTSTLAVGADKKRTEDETKSLGVTLAEKNRPSVSYLRTENDKTDTAGAKTTTVSDKGELIGKFAGASVTAKTLQSRSQLPGGKEAGIEQNALGLALGPTLLLRTEDLKSDGKTAHGIVTDKFDTKKRVGRADITVASLAVATTTPDQKKTSAETQKVDVKLPGGVSVTRLTDEKVDLTGAKTATETQKADLTSKVGAAAITASTAQINTTTPDPKTTGTSQEMTVALTGSGATKGTGATVALIGGAGQTGAGTEQKQGVSVKLQPTPALALSAEQKDHIVTPGTGAAKVISTQGATAELRPMAGTVITGAWRMSLDGASELSVTEYAAQLGKDRGAFQFHGGMVNRASTAGGLGALDSARANLKLRPAPGLLLSTNYTLNPEEKGVVTPLTRREYGLEAKAGSLELGGAYASTALSLLSPDALKQQAGAMEYGEYTLSVGLRFSPTAKLTTLLKDSFYTGAPKGLRSFGLGFSHSAGDAFLQLSGTMTTNRTLVGSARNDVKAEAKLGVKF